MYSIGYEEPNIDGTGLPHKDVGSALQANRGRPLFAGSCVYMFLYVCRPSRRASRHAVEKWKDVVHCNEN